MTRRMVTNLMTPIGDVLAAVGTEGVLLDAVGHETVAVLPVNDDLLDYFLEHSPKLIAECQHLREELESGDYVPHDEVLRLLNTDEESESGA